MPRESEARKHYIEMLDRHGSFDERREDAARARRPMGFKAASSWGPQGVPKRMFFAHWYDDEAPEPEDR